MQVHTHKHTQQNALSFKTVSFKVILLNLNVCIFVCYSALLEVRHSKRELVLSIHAWGPTCLNVRMHMPSKHMEVKE